MTIEEFRKTTPSTETVETLVSVYLDRLSKAECEPADQPMASIILGEAIRRAEETANTAWEVSRIFARGLETERLS